MSQQNTGEEPRALEEQPTASSSGGVSALKDRFKDTAPMGTGAAPPIPRGREEEAEPSPPPVPDTSRPSGGFALPGLPSRPAAADEEEEPEDPNAYVPERESSPVRVAIPVSRGAETAVEEEQRAPPPIPPTELNVPQEDDLPDEREQTEHARAAAEAVAEQSFEPEQVGAAHSGQGGYQAVIQYDYEKAEDNEIELVEGQYVVEIDMVDEDWWLGTNSKGERGLFPSNYVELVADEDAGAAPAPPVAEPAPPVPAASRPADMGPTATALYDYEAAEDNGMFKDPMPSFT